MKTGSSYIAVNRSRLASGSAGSKTKDLLQSTTVHYHEEQHRSCSSKLVTISLLFPVGLMIYLVICQLLYPAQILERSYPSTASKISYVSDTLPRPLVDEVVPRKSASTSEKLSTGTLSTISKGESLLESTLRNASMKNKTVIITTLNAAWTRPNSIFDLFLESFRIGNETKNLLNHLLVVAIDPTAYSRCVEIHSHCYALTTDGVDFSGRATYMTSDYLKMIWRRNDFLSTVLELGYNFIFTDADVMWFRDPFPIFYADADIQMSRDYFYHSDTASLKNWPNGGGFKYVKSNNRTIQFYNFWRKSKDYFPGKHDQDIFNKIKSYPYVSKIGIRMKFLSTKYFGGLCEPSRDHLDEVVTMHANCCIELEKKVHDLKMIINDWKNYLATPTPERNSTTKSWTQEWYCGYVGIKTSWETKKNYAVNNVL